MHRQALLSEELRERRARLAGPRRRDECAQIAEKAFRLLCAMDCQSTGALRGACAFMVRRSCARSLSSAVSLRRTASDAPCVAASSTTFSRSIAARRARRRRRVGCLLAPQFVQRERDHAAHAIRREQHREPVHHARLDLLARDCQRARTHERPAVLVPAAAERSSPVRRSHPLGLRAFEALSPPGLVTPRAGHL